GREGRPRITTELAQAVRGRSPRAEPGAQGERGEGLGETPPRDRRVQEEEQRNDRLVRNAQRKQGRSSAARRVPSLDELLGPHEDTTRIGKCRERTRRGRRKRQAPLQRKHHRLLQGVAETRSN